jgi:MATE family multidrug resistance protein
VERTRSVLVLQLWINGVNGGLDLWFVLGLGWGVPGVAAATLVAEWTGLALGLWLCRDAFADRAGRAWARILNRVQLVEMGRVNTDIMLRSVLLQGSFTTFVFLGAGLGDVTLAANQVLMQFFTITAYALDGFAFAAETLVGQAVGARQPAQVRRASVVTSGCGVAGSVLLAAGFWFGGPVIIDLMATDPAVREAARAFLPWVALGPLIGIASWMFDGIFIGATLTREMRNAMALSVAIYAAAVALLLPAFGNHGLWGALMVLNAARAVSMAALYPRAEAKAA